MKLSEMFDCTDSDYRVCEESGLDDLHRPQLVQYLKNLGLKTKHNDAIIRGALYH
jgi:hypothetical protein